jgi:hypothetical protein
MNVVFSRGWLARCASVYAWFFAVGSLLALLLILVTSAASAGTTSSGIFCWTIDDGTRHTAWLMNYTGVGGLALAAIEATLLVGAIIGSCVQGSGGRVRPTLRHASLLYLLGWSALWLAGAARLMLAMQTWDTALYTLGSAVAVAATYARARSCWSLPTGSLDASRSHPITA